MRKLVALPRAGSGPSHPRFAAIRAENAAAFLPLVGGKAPPRPPGSRAGNAPSGLEDLLAFAVRNQPRPAAQAPTDPAQRAAVLAGLSDQVFTASDFERFRRGCDELAAHCRHGPLSALAARIPYLPTLPDRRRAIGALFAGAEALRPHARALVLAALVPAVHLDPDSKLRDETARHAMMLQALPKEERGPVDRAVAAIRLFTDPNGLEQAFLKTPEVDRAAFVDHRLRVLIEALPPDHRFEPISALVELRGHVKRPEIGIHVVTMLFHAATALPADHFFGFLLRFAHLGGLDDAMTEISLGHLLSALGPFTDERFGAVLKIALHPEGAPLRESQLRIVRPPIERALLARERAARRPDGGRG